MEIVREFGINPGLLLAQIMNFLIVLFVLKKFLYKPLLETLKKRQQTIKEGLEQAEEAKIALEKANQKEEEILRKAQTQAKSLLEEAKQQRVDLLKDAEEKTKKQVELMLKQAREQIEFDTKQAEKQLSAHISDLAVTFLQKSLPEFMTKDEQSVFMQNAVKKLKKKAD